MDALAAAVRNNDTAAVRRVLADHSRLGSRLDEAMPGGAFGATPLLEAVHRKNREMVELLLTAGADINARSHWWAGSYGVLDNASGMEQLLIERGATVDVHAAARLGRMDRVRALVEHDQDLVHARGGDGGMPLHFASTPEVAGFLLDHGADIDAIDVDHESTAAQYMVRDRAAVARYLVERGCRTDLLLVSALGDSDRVRQVLDRDPETIHLSVSPRHFPMRDARAGGTIYFWTLGERKTPHLAALDGGHTDVFGLLMERSPDALRLAMACEVGNEAQVEALLSRDPKLAAKLGEDTRERLASAAFHGNFPALRLMLRAGWPLEVPGHDGGTALHWAAFHGRTDMVAEILRYGPNLELADQHHQGTALGWARYGSNAGWSRDQGDYPGTIALLLQAGAKEMGS